MRPNLGDIPYINLIRRVNIKLALDQIDKRGLAVIAIGGDFILLTVFHPHICFSHKFTRCVETKRIT